MPSTQTPNRTTDHRAGPERSRGGTAGGTPTPPLLIGGVKQQIPNRTMYPLGAGVDFCTVTLPTESARHLLDQTGNYEAGSGYNGFQSSEQRVILGGFAWRRWNPVTPSNQFGTDYESWESSGEASRALAQLALKVPGYATRQDYAFDFGCSPDLMPRDLLPLFRDHIAAKGMEASFAGPESSCTVYVGSRNSDRRLKIYRRDLKDEALIVSGAPPMIRVEIEIKGDPCKALWFHRRTTAVDGLSIAATHIADMIGWAVYDDLSPLPDPLEATDEADAAQMLLQFIEQNASLIEAAAAVGLDLARLARVRLGTASRATQWRHQRRMEQINVLDHDAVRAHVRSRLLGIASKGVA